MDSRSRKAFFVCAMAMTAFAHAQESCDFLTLDAVSKALPQYQPWRVAGGSTGRCRFEGENHRQEHGGATTTPVIFNVTQQFQSSPQKAVHFVRGVKAEIAKRYDLSAFPGVGAESFFYTGGSQDTNALWWFTHTGKAVVSGMYVPPGNRTLTDAEQSAVKSLVAEALSASNRPGMAEQAGQCPHFDRALIKKLISPKGLKVQQFGNDSCVANNGANAVVMFSRVRLENETSGSQLAQAKVNAPCTSEKLPEFGPFGLLIHSCTAGNPQAEVFFIKGRSAYEFSVIPGKEPTAQQRTDLIALARRSFEAQ